MSLEALKIPKFIKGQCVKLLQMPPKDFVGFYQKTPILYSGELGFHIIDYPNGWYKLQGRFQNASFKIIDITNRKYKVKSSWRDEYEFDEDLLTLSDIQW